VEQLAANKSATFHLTHTHSHTARQFALAKPPFTDIINIQNIFPIYGSLWVNESRELNYSVLLSLARVVARMEVMCGFDASEFNEN
jgi:hypothetical protein